MEEDIEEDKDVSAETEKVLEKSFQVVNLPIYQIQDYMKAKLATIIWFSTTMLKGIDCS